VQRLRSRGGKMNFHDENGHEYVTPYNVFEAIHGAYDPDELSQKITSSSFAAVMGWRF
jgi:hypothetical protein